MPDIFARLSFSAQVRARVWKQLARLIQNRMRLKDALELLKGQAEERKPPLARIYAHILRVMGSGNKIGVALHGLASSEEILLIDSSQDGSHLKEGLALAGKVLEAKASIRKSLVAALSYPLILLLLIVMMMYIVAERVMPQLVMLSNPEDWTGAPWWLHAQSSLVASWRGAALGCTLLAVAVLVLFSFSRWTGPTRRLADKFVPWSIYRLTIGTLWLYAVATRMQAGHQISSILRSMAQDRSTSPYLREIVRAILDSSGKGIDFGQALKNSGMAFPSPELADSLAVYSRMSDFEQHIIELADGWLEDGIENIQRLAGKLKVLMFGLVIGQLCLVALAIGGLQSQLQGGM